MTAPPRSRTWWRRARRSVRARLVALFLLLALAMAAMVQDLQDGEVFIDAFGNPYVWTIVNATP